MAPRRKKWSEEEERTLIDKYAEMVGDGTLSKMKTREKKFRPIAAHVNLVHHSRDPTSFPWQWCWKDASTKVQNMRHQYLLVKQKIKKPTDSGAPDDYDWVDGLTYWSNFLRYKGVFGDVPDLPAVIGGVRRGAGAVRIDGPDGFGFDSEDNGVMGLGLGFEYDEDDGNQNSNCGDNGDDNCDNPVKENGDEGFDYDGAVVPVRKRRKRLKGLERRAMAFILDRFAELRAREARLEKREAERERERRRWERCRAEEEDGRERAREKARIDRFREWEAMEKECVERERRRREEELVKEREWEERLERRRLDWKKRMDDVMTQHRAAMDQLQSRIVHEQQSIINQLLGVVSQWTGHSAGISDHTGAAGNPYLSQMIPNLHHVNGIDNPVGGNNHDDQFIVDG